MSWIKIATTSFSAASTVNVDNVFSATYTHYMVTRNFSGSLADYNVDVRMRVSSADDTGANYRNQLVNATSTTVGGGRTTGATVWTAALGYTQTTAIGYGMLRISNPFDAARTTAWADQGYTVTGNIVLARYVFAHDLATSYTGFSIIPLTATITGSITVYGLKES